MAFGSPSCSTALCCSPHFLPILECIISERLSQSQFPNYSAAIQAAAVGLRATDEGEFVSNFRTNIITPFHGPQPPPCSPISFLRRLVRHAHCSETAFVTALYYLDIIALRRPELAINALNIHRLFLTATLLASKYLDDVRHDNSHYAYIGELDVSEINRLEMEGLVILNYGLFIKPSDFSNYEAKQVMNALSRSGIHNDIKLQLSEIAQNVWKVWEGWKVNFEDVEYVRKRNGDRKRIGKGGAGDVYLARMKLRDGNGVVYPGKYIPVAVKQIVVKCTRVKAEFLQFIREVYLQKHSNHPCIVRTLGGYWPDPEKAEDGEIEACIVMERMTHNLNQVQDRQLLSSMDEKLRILSDVAAGIEHLHSRGIVHRDIKPENVLMREADGNIIGRAKLCDFGVSRKAAHAYLVADTMRTYTRPTGTSLYMPPEAFSSSAHSASTPARDIWSFGVLMCEILVPGFLANIVRNYPEGVEAITGSGQFAKEVAESVLNITCDQTLKYLAVSCLSLDPMLRPRIGVVSETLANRIAAR